MQGEFIFFFLYSYLFQELQVFAYDMNCFGNLFFESFCVEKAGEGLSQVFPMEANSFFRTREEGNKSRFYQALKVKGDLVLFF